MDSKYVRTTVDNLLAELERNPAIGRRPSPSFMSRYGRPLGLGIALGIGGVAGCSGSSEESKGNPDALPAAKDAPAKDVMYPPVDAYGMAMPDRPADLYLRSEVVPMPVDAYGVGIPDRPPTPDVRFLDGSVDLYGISADALRDTRDALPPPWDLYAAPPWDTRTADIPTSETRDVLPLFGDAYGMSNPDRPVDTAAAPDAGKDADDTD